MRRYVLPSIFILGGLFFVLLPFIGSKSETAQHTGALNGISLVFGLIIVAIATWSLVNGIRSR